jgi:ubiquitin-activating enzyme E1
VPKVINFESFSQQLKNPELMISDFAKFNCPSQLHVGIQALHKFATEHYGQFPRPHNEADAKEVYGIASKLAKEYEGMELDERPITELSYCKAGLLSKEVAMF